MSYALYAANTIYSQTKQMGIATGYATVYTDVIPLLFAVCPECIQSQKVAQSRAKTRWAIPLLGVGLAALVIGLIIPKSVSCIFPLIVMGIGFGFGGGLLAANLRANSMLDLAARGRLLNDTELIYMFGTNLNQLAVKNGRKVAISSTFYEHLKQNTDPRNLLG